MSSPKSLGAAISQVEASLGSKNQKSKNKNKGKGVKKSTGQKILSTVGKVATVAESLAPLLALAPAVLARHPDYVGHPSLKTQITSAPQAFGGISQTTTRFNATMRKDRMVVTSTDVIDEVKWVQQSAETHRDIGSPIFAVSIDPYSKHFKGTRVQLLARAYQQWTIKRANFIFVPMAPTTAVGAFAMFTTTDPDEVISEAGIAAVKSVMAHAGATEFPLWLPASCNYVPVPGREFYSSALNGTTNVQPDEIEAGLEARQTSAGQVGIFAASDLYPFSDGVNSFYTYGQVMVDWELEFFNPVAEDLRDLQFLGKSITAAQGATVTTAQPLGSPSATYRGWAGWSRDLPVAGAVAFPDSDLDITLGDSGRIFDLPLGFYFAWLYISSVTGSMVGVNGSSANSNIVILSQGRSIVTGATSQTSWIYFCVNRAGDATVQDFIPFGWSTAPTGVDNDDMRLVIARFAPFQNTLTSAEAPLGDPSVLTKRHEARRARFRQAVLRAMAPYMADLEPLPPQVPTLTAPGAAPPSTPVERPNSLSVSPPDVATLLAMLSASRVLAEQPSPLSQ